jgi:hypothetical protein
MTTVMITERSTVSTGTGHCAGPDELGGHVAQLGVGSLGGVGEDGERLVLLDLVPLHQDAFGLFDTGARHHRGAQLSEILAGAGCCFCIADRNRDPGSNLVG